VIGKRVHAKPYENSKFLMIKFEHVGLRYGIGPEVLSDINFTLEPGSFHFLTGSSGAGKSSLLSLMFLGRKPTRGIISMFNQKLSDLRRHQLSGIRQKIGVVFQEFRLLPHLSAFDNVALPMRIAGHTEKEIHNNVNELLDWVGLGDYKNVLPETLSGGQQQRVAIARAVIARPKLLLADEPTGNLDDNIGYRLMNLFEQLNRMGTTIVIATHNHAMMNTFNYPRMILDQGQLHIHETQNSGPKTERVQ
jgi:cell division transport system ATP-binding protein